MMGAVVSFTAMAVAGRELQAGMNTFELMLYRSAIGFAIVVLLARVSEEGFAQLKSAHMGMHLKRNLVHYTGQNLWFFAVVQIPLSQLVALEFTNPIWVALLAPLLLGERMTRARLVGALIGFLGVLVVAQPGRAPLEAGHVAALVAAVLFALNTIFTKQIMRHDTVLCVLFWMTLLQGVASLVAVAAGRHPGADARQPALDPGRRHHRAFRALFADLGARLRAGLDRRADGVRAAAVHRARRHVGLWRAAAPRGLRRRRADHRRQPRQHPRRAAAGRRPEFGLLLRLRIW